MNPPTHSADLTVSILLDQVQTFWDGRFRPHLEGMDDAEYLWEPTAGAWSLRPGARFASSNPSDPNRSLPPSSLGINPDAPVTIDWDEPTPSPPPIATIAWRMGHLTVLMTKRIRGHATTRRQRFETFPYTLNARDALDQMDANYAGWIEGVKGLLDSDLPRPVGPCQGPWSEDWLGLVIGRMHQMIIERGAEIRLLRELYADRATLGRQ